MHYQCRHCSWTGQANLSWQGDHVRADCPECEKFIKFVKQDSMDHGDFRALQEWQANETGTEEQWVMGTYDDGSEEQLGEITIDTTRELVELEIDGVIWKPEL